MLGSAGHAAAGAKAPLTNQAIIAEQRARLLDCQQSDGHILFELEADSTIPSEYVLLHHFLGEIHEDRQAKIAVYIRRIQNLDGSWPLFHDGDGNISATIKAYWALKLIGDPLDAPHMARARAWILSQGGAANANVFTRIMMALFGQIPWRGVPVMPVEIMHLPVWFPFHLSKVAYWSRTVLVPLLVLYAYKARAANPTGLDIRELFVVPPEEHKVYNVNPNGARAGNLFLQLDRLLQVVEPYFPKRSRRNAVVKAEKFFLERLNGEDGLGAIYPAMANSVMAMRVLGYPDDDPAMMIARKSIEKLVIETADEVFCQPCLSPVWDTGLAAHALMEAGERDDPNVERMLDWLKDRQILHTRGDWSVRRPDVRPGGWAFQYANDHYPDVDDTAVVALAMHRQGDAKYGEAIERACEWLVGMQSSGGGWGAFEPENHHHYLNSIPFADHGALLDPPTADVTARCVGCLSQVDRLRYGDAVRLGIDFLKRDQEADGSWFGRWGANYVYGTWSVLVALNGAGEDMSAPYIRKAVEWLKSRQLADDGWGEGLETYQEGRKTFARTSTASQTAWAVMALMSAGEYDSPEVRSGIEYLRTAERDGARWKERHWTGTGFPKVFYLKYHGYAAYFPLWAMARHEKLKASNDKTVIWGM